MSVRERLRIGDRRGLANGSVRVAGSVGPAVLFGAALVGAWHAFVVLEDVPTVILPTPLEVAVTLVRSAPTLLGDAWTTVLTATGGLLGGTCVGLLLAFAMVRSRVASAVVHPYLVASRIAPLVAIAPLVFLWLGDGLLARAALVTTMTTFPVAVASLDGLRATPDAYLDLLESVDAPPRDVFVRVRVPAAAPSVFAGLKLASVLSVTGTVVAEFLTLTGGIGYRVFRSSTYLQTRTTYAALAVLAAVGLAFYLVPVAVERAIGW